MTNANPLAPEDEREHLHRHMVQTIVDAREQTAEGLRQHSINIMLLNVARSSKETPGSTIALRAANMRDHEKVVEAYMGKECEAWMNYYQEFGVPGEMITGGEATTARDWVKPVRLPDGS